MTWGRRHSHSVGPPHAEVDYLEWFISNIGRHFPLHCSLLFTKGSDRNDGSCGPSVITHGSLWDICLSDKTRVHLSPLKSGSQKSSRTPLQEITWWGLKGTGVHACVHVCVFMCACVWQTLQESQSFLKPSHFFAMSVAILSDFLGGAYTACPTTFRTPTNCRFDKTRHQMSKCNDIIKKNMHRNKMHNFYFCPECSAIV